MRIEPSGLAHLLSRFTNNLIAGLQNDEWIEGLPGSMFGLLDIP